MQGRNASRSARMLWPLALFVSLLGYLAFGQDEALGRCDPAVELPVGQVSGLDGSPPEDGAEVRVGGVVTGTFLGDGQLDGFFLQSDDAGSPAGLFVYAPRLRAEFRRHVEPGNRLQVAGRRGTWRDQPQLQRVERIDFCGEPGKPPAVSLTLPAEAESLDSLFGVLVELPQTLTITGNHELGVYGSLDLAASRLFRERSGIGGEGLERLVLDDGSYARNPDPVPYLDAASGTRRVGDRVRGVRGVLVHQFDAWRLHPVTEPEFEVGNPRPEAPSRLPGLQVASMNVENYFITPGERGAADAGELERQRGKLLPALAGLDADLLALIEIENDPAALDDLLDHLNRRVDRPYARLENDPETGTDAIRMAWIYRPDRLEPVGGPTSDGDPVHHRPPLAAAFRPVDGGEPFLAAVVHFKSKTGCPASGDIDRGEGCWNQRRTEQARALARFMEAESEHRGVEQVLLAGDFNSYAAEAPIRLLERDGYRNLVRAYLPAERHYTYVFRGASGMLDYLFVNAAMAERVTGVDVWHINADEPRFFGYDTGHPEAESALGTSYRSSDHDPVRMGID